MSRSPFTIILLATCTLITSCDRNKPKPASKDINKTTVTVNGKKDSVINNPYKNYGNATVADPCVRCLIQVIQNDPNYRRSVAGKPVNTIKYVVNWIASEKADSTSARQATSGLKVDIIEKTTSDKRLSTFIYDNSLLKIYFVNYGSNNAQIETNSDSVTLKRIRNACYWGVVSGK